MVAWQATLCPYKALIERKQSFVYFKNVVVAMLYKIFDYYIGLV